MNSVNFFSHFSSGYTTMKSIFIPQLTVDTHNYLRRDEIFPKTQFLARFPSIRLADHERRKIHFWSKFRKTSSRTHVLHEIYGTYGASSVTAFQCSEDYAYVDQVVWSYALKSKCIRFSEFKNIPPCDRDWFFYEAIETWLYADIDTASALKPGPTAIVCAYLEHMALQSDPLQSKDWPFFEVYRTHPTTTYLTGSSYYKCLAQFDIDVGPIADHIFFNSLPHAIKRRPYFTALYKEWQFLEQACRQSFHNDIFVVDTNFFFLPTVVLDALRALRLVSCTCKFMCDPTDYRIPYYGYYMTVAERHLRSYDKYVVQAQEHRLAAAAILTEQRRDRTHYPPTPSWEELPSHSAPIRTKLEFLGSRRDTVAKIRKHLLPFTRVVEFGQVLDLSKLLDLDQLMMRFHVHILNVKSWGASKTPFELDSYLVAWASQSTHANDQQRVSKALHHLHRHHIVHLGSVLGLYDFHYVWRLLNMQTPTKEEQLRFYSESQGLAEHIALASSGLLALAVAAAAYTGHRISVAASDLTHTVHLAQVQLAETTQRSSADVITSITTLTNSVQKSVSEATKVAKDTVATWSNPIHDLWVKFKEMVHQMMSGLLGLPPVAFYAIEALLALIFFFTALSWLVGIASVQELVYSFAAIFAPPVLYFLIRFLRFQSRPIVLMPEPVVLPSADPAFKKSWDARSASLGQTTPEDSSEPQGKDDEPITFGHFLDLLGVYIPGTGAHPKSSGLIDTIPKFARLGQAIEWFTSRIPNMVLHCVSLVTGKPIPRNPAEMQLVQLIDEADEMIVFKESCGSWHKAFTAQADRIRKIQDLYSRLNHHEYLLSRDSVAAHIRTTFMARYRLIMTGVAESRSYYGTSQRRPLPIIVLFSGPPSVGKTEAAQVWLNKVYGYMSILSQTEPLLASIAHKYRDKFDSSKVWPRPIGQSFADGYHNQPLMLWDEFMSSKLQEQRGQDASLFLTYASTAPCPLPMADMQQMGTVLVADFAALTSNLTYFSDCQVEDQEAFNQRFTLIIEPVITPFHAKHKGKRVFRVLHRKRKIKLEERQQDHDLYKSETAVVDDEAVELYVNGKMVYEVDMDELALICVRLFIQQLREDPINDVRAPEDIGTFSITHNHPRRTLTCNDPQVSVPLTPEQVALFGLTEAQGLDDESLPDLESEMRKLVSEHVDALTDVWVEEKIPGINGSKVVALMLLHPKMHAKTTAKFRQDLYDHWKSQAQSWTSAVMSIEHYQWTLLWNSRYGTMIKEQRECWDDRNYKAAAKAPQPSVSTSYPTIITPDEEPSAGVLETALFYMMNIFQPPSLLEWQKTNPETMERLYEGYRQGHALVLPDSPPGFTKETFQYHMKNALWLRLIRDCIALVAIAAITVTAVGYAVRATFSYFCGSDKVDSELSSAPQSGDLRTHHTRTRVQTTNVGQAKEVNIRLINKSAAAQGLTDTKSLGAFNQVFSNLHYNNYGGIKAFGLGLTHDIHVTSEHVLQAMDASSTIEINCEGGGSMCTIAWADCVILRVPEEQQVYIRTPGINFYKDIRKHFRDIQPQGQVYRPHVTYDASREYVVIEKADEWIPLNPRHLGADRAVASMDNARGYCGLPYIMPESKYGFTVSGIHVAGSQTHRYNYYSTITKTRVDEAVNALLGVYTYDDVLPRFDGSSPAFPLLNPAEKIGMVVPGTTPQGAIPRGHPIPFIPSDSCITDSDLHPDNPMPYIDDQGPIVIDWHKPTRRPAVLQRQPGKPPPATFALRKYSTVAGEPNVSPPLREVDLTRVDFSDYLPPNWKAPTDPLMTIEEACNSLDFSKSAGFPESCSGIGRRQLVMYDDGRIKPAFRARVESVISLLSTNIRPAVVVDTLKDELLPNEDVDEGKARLFCVMELSYVVIAIMYFKRSFDALTTTPFETPIAIGLNAHSSDWTLLHARLASNGVGNTIAFDFKGHEFTLHPRLPARFAAAFDEWVPLDDDHTRLRTNLIFSLLFVTHLFGSTVYSVRKGQGSGSLLTSMYSSFCTYVVMAVCWYYIVGPDKKFKDYVQVTIQGDDLLATVRDTPIYTQVSLAAAAKLLFGMHATSFDKRRDLTQYENLYEVEFLKRSFRVVTPFLVLAPLRISVVYETAMWEKERATREDLHNTHLSVLNECVHHGHQIYEKLRKLFVRHNQAARNGYTYPSHADQWLKLCESHSITHVQSPQ